MTSTIMEPVSKLLDRVDRLVSCDLLESAEALCSAYLTSKGCSFKSNDPSQIALLEKSKLCMEVFI